MGGVSMLDGQLLPLAALVAVASQGMGGRSGRSWEWRAWPSRRHSRPWEGQVWRTGRRGGRDTGQRAPRSASLEVQVGRKRLTRAHLQVGRTKVGQLLYLLILSQGYKSRFMSCLCAEKRQSYMKEQVYGPVDMLLCKRRKVPQTALDMWKFCRTSRKGSSFLLQPLVQGMCTYLHETYNRNFPRVSDPDAEPTSSEPMADYGGSQDAPSERQPTPKSHGNEDRPPEGELTPVNLDLQSEPQLTPKSLGGAGAAPDEDMLPEFPRFSPADMPSPTREDDTPFKPCQTPHSGSGGLGATEMPQSVTSYSLPGSTPHSDHMESPFPVNDDFDGQPEIPGLISTPGGISSAGTGTTGLGSMSARTRAVALFFKDHVPSSTSDEHPGKFSLSKILEGKVRKQAARMFFETMVLKSYDYIDVKQEEPYSDIEISVRPSLADAKL